MFWNDSSHVSSHFSRIMLKRSRNTFSKRVILNLGGLHCWIHGNFNKKVHESIAKELKTSSPRVKFENSFVEPNFYFISYIWCDDHLRGYFEINFSNLFLAYPLAWSPNYEDVTCSEMIISSYQIDIELVTTHLNSITHYCNLPDVIIL